MNDPPTPPANHEWRPVIQDMVNGKIQSQGSNDQNIIESNPNSKLNLPNNNQRAGAMVRAEDTPVEKGVTTNDTKDPW